MLQVIQRNRYVALIAAAALTLGIYLVKTNTFVISDTTQETVINVIRALACWSWLVAITGIGSRQVNFSNRFLKYASDAVLPVYILHQTLIVLIGYYIIQRDTGVAVKYSLVLIATLVISLGLYELVKRTNITRFLFGMKAMKPQAIVPDRDSRVEEAA